MRLLHAAALSCMLLRATEGMIVNGVVTDCFGGFRSFRSDIDVFVIDALNSRKLIALLKSVEKTPPDENDHGAAQRWMGDYDRLTKMIKSSRRIASAKSSHGGRFEVRLRQFSEHIYVFAYASSVDGPAAFAYAEIHPAGRTTIEVSLDFGRGRCGP